MKDSPEQNDYANPDTNIVGKAKTFTSRGILPDALPEQHSREEAAKTTIVGGRPPTTGRPQINIPRGIEVLIKKASVDSAFRQLLLEKRSAAASEIGLDLSPAEAATINAAPAAQLEQIIASTKVPDMHRRIFLGQAGAAMLAALTLGLAGCGTQPATPAPTGPAIVPTPKVTERIVEKGFEKDVTESTISVSVHSETAKWARVLVDYTCVFRSGEIFIDFRQDPDVVGADLTYEPAQAIAVSPGKGAVTFHISGSGGTTDWLIARLRSTTTSCAGSAELSPPKHYQDGAHVRHLCAIWQVMKYHKEWSSQE